MKQILLKRHLHNYQPLEQQTGSNVLFWKRFKEEESFLFLFKFNTFFSVSFGGGSFFFLFLSKISILHQQVVSEFFLQAGRKAIFECQKQLLCVKISHSQRYFGEEKKDSCSELIFLKYTVSGMLAIEREDIDINRLRRNK